MHADPRRRTSDRGFDLFKGAARAVGPAAEVSIESGRLRRGRGVELARVLEIRNVCGDAPEARGVALARSERLLQGFDPRDRFTVLEVKDVQPAHERGDVVTRVRTRKEAIARVRGEDYAHSAAEVDRLVGAFALD